MDIEFGKKYRDKVTGIEGVAIGKSTWITGCDTIGLAREKDGEQQTNWFDEGRVEPVDSEKIEAKAEKRGGPQVAPKQANTR